MGSGFVFALSLGAPPGHWAALLPLLLPLAGNQEGAEAGGAARETRTRAVCARRAKRSLRADGERGFVARGRRRGGQAPGGSLRGSGLIWAKGASLWAARWGGGVQSP